MVVGSREERFSHFVYVARQEFPKSLRRVERGDLMRPIEWVADVMMPGDFAVRGIQERHTESAEIKGARLQSARISLGLQQNFLRTERQLLRFHNPKNLAVGTEGVIRRACLGGIFFNGTVAVYAEGAVGFEGNNSPTCRSELEVNDVLSSQVFRFGRRRLLHMGDAFGLMWLHRFTTF